MQGYCYAPLPMCPITPVGPMASICSKGEIFKAGLLCSLRLTLFKTPKPTLHPHPNLPEPISSSRSVTHLARRILHMA